LYDKFINFKGHLNLFLGSDIDIEVINIFEKMKCIKKLVISVSGKYKLKSDSLEELKYSGNYLDFSECANLKHLILEECNNIESFDITHHPLLESLRLEILSFQNINPQNKVHTSLTRLELRNQCSDMIYNISNYPNLKELEIGEYFSGTIICNNTLNINKLIINNDGDYSNILQNCKYLENIVFGVNNSYSINLINFTNLKKLCVRGKSIDALDVTNLPKSIEYIELGEIYPHDINWKHLNNLKQVIFGGFDYALDDSKLPSSIETITLGSMYNSNIELYHMPNLREILFSYDSLFESSINVSQCKNLKIIRFGTEFNQPISTASIPNTIEEIFLGPEYNRQLINPLDYPHIKCICFGIEIDNCIINNEDTRNYLKIIHDFI